MENACCQGRLKSHKVVSWPLITFHIHTHQKEIQPCEFPPAIASKARSSPSREGPVTTEVTIETAAGEKIVSSITSNSAQNLGLKVGDKAYAVIKASSVMVAVD